MVELKLGDPIFYIGENHSVILQTVLPSVEVWLFHCLCAANFQSEFNCNDKH